MHGNKFKLAVVSAAMLLSAVGWQGAKAATTTTTFTAQIIIQADCQIQSATNLDFGTSGVLSAVVNATSDIGVQCTNTTAYNIGLNAGTTAGGSIATRKMTDGTATVDYRMFSDAGRTTNWGNTVGTDTVSATGNGAVQTHTVFGQVPVQTTPAPATYTDTVTVTVTF